MGAALTCVDCSAALPEGASFCPSCGSPQPALCSGCGAALTAGARFCSVCGSSVASPPPIEPEIVAQSERRWASVLFADLVGFTSLSESRDPEQVRELLSLYFARCREIVTAYDGVVEKFIGDAVMAVWGVPTAHEDDAERAVRAGRDLAAMVSALGDDLRAPLSLRVGIVTGEVAATLSSLSEGMVAGDPVNTASRVQSAAAPGQVWVDESTRSLTSHIMDFADTGEHRLKGKADPVRLFAALSLRDEPVALDAIEAPMFGRDSELALLRDLFLSCAAERRPRLVVVYGDAGVGKSRLVHEFEGWLADRPQITRWHRGRCLSYGDGVAFRALREAVRTRLGLVEADAGAIVTGRLDDVLGGLAPDDDERDWLRAGLGLLVGEDASRTIERGELFSAWTRFFELVGAGDPVVLVVDDAHHADDGLLDFVEHALATSRTSLLVVALARPELLDRRPGWGGRHAAVIPLNPLGTDAMSSLIGALLQGLPGDMSSTLAQRSGGNPLFAVETVRALVDDGRAVVAGGRAALVDDLDRVSAPASLRALVRSRLDGLPPDARRVVADAAVLGLTCTLEGLAALAPPGLDLRSAVATLQRREVLTVEDDRFSGERGQLRFVHAVVRQVSYETLSRRDRKARHLAAARHLSAQDAPDLDAVVAQHYLDALEAAFDDDPDNAQIRRSAVQRLEAAARYAAALGSPSSARGYFLRASTLADRPGDIASLLTNAAEQGIQAGQQVDVVAEATEALSMFDDLGDERGGRRAVVVLANALNWTGRYEDMHVLLSQRFPDVSVLEGGDRTSFDVLASISLARQNLGLDAHDVDALVIELGEQSDDPVARYTAEHVRASVRMHAGDRQGAIHAYEAAARIAREPGSGLCEAVSLNNVASLALEDDGDAALALVREGVAAARRAGARNAEEWARGSELEFLTILGRYDEALALLEALDIRDLRPQTQLLMSATSAWLASITGRFEPDAPDGAVVESWGNRYSAASQTLAVAQWRGDRAGAAAAAGTALHALLEDNGGWGVWDVLPHVARAALESRDPQLEAQILDLMRRQSRTPSPLQKAVEPWVRALLSDPDDGQAQAEAQIRSALPGLQSFGALGYAAQAEGDLGCWLLAQGQRAEGERVVEAALGRLEELGALGWGAQLRRRSSAPDPWRGQGLD